MHVMSPGRCLALALAVAASASACARPPSNEHERNPAMSGATQTGRTLNGHTYTDAPVDVKLGPTTFRFPANYLDSQIAPWPGEGVTLVIEWPDMKPTAPGARADPRTNDFRKEISVRINYVDRVPVEGLLERYASNELITEAGSLEREDPRERLDLRTALPEMLGLTPYAIDEARMVQYAKLYQERSGAPPVRNPAFEKDWYAARQADGRITSFIKCDAKAHFADGVRLVGGSVVQEPGVRAASCVHYFVDLDDKLSVRLDYKRVFLKDWKRMEDAVRSVLSSARSN
ncbi:hypothetical protein DCO49_02430 [Stenotrophomonas sp. SPM]|uniref:Smlt3025 familytype IV secretion system inhibitor n=1 Tax=Stenotrophomonas sp. SPM TaxID=2170735 RepID=UPI000DE78756|nr:hypothetical protein [Stenotrophomonas sp. SPM]PWB29404.1 hypothetical protein DCO49_02430 [Stenotrophomonas sp. SPM]